MRRPAIPGRAPVGDETNPEPRIARSGAETASRDVPGAQVYPWRSPGALEPPAAGWRADSGPLPWSLHAIASPAAPAFLDCPVCPRSILLLVWVDRAGTGISHNGNPLGPRGEQGGALADGTTRDWRCA